MSGTKQTQPWSQQDVYTCISICMYQVGQYLNYHNVPYSPYCVPINQESFNVSCNPPPTGPGHGHVKHGLRARRRSEARRTALPGEPREGAHQEEDPVIRDLWQP